MTQVEELLSAWRDAERLLDSLPPFSEDHETVQMAIIRLKAAYQQVTDRRPGAEDVVAMSQEALREANAVLDRVRVSDALLATEPQGEPA